LQSYKVTSRLGRSFLPFSFLGEPVAHPSNYINSVRVGRGLYPASFFLKRYDYQFSPWPDAGHDNKKLLRGLLFFIRNLGAYVLVRDKSFLGFPTFQVIVPGISEVEEPAGIFVPSVVLKNEVEEIMRNLPSASVAQCEKLLSHILERAPYMMECRRLSGFLNFPVKDSFPWDSLSVPLFLAMIYYRKGDPDRSCGILNSIVNNMGRSGAVKSNTPDYNYLKCVRDYLLSAKSNIDKNKIPGILRRFYSARIVKRVLSEWGKADKVFEKFDVLPCGACGACKLRRHCLKNHFKNLYCKLKVEIAENPITQESLKEFALFSRCH
jgi:ribosomal protein S12 methylthiotransferase accessory factor